MFPEVGAPDEVCRTPDKVEAVSALTGLCTSSIKRPVSVAKTFAFLIVSLSFRTYPKTKVTLLAEVGSSIHLISLQSEQRTEHRRQNIVRWTQAS